MALPSAHPLTPRHATPWQKRVTLIRKTHTEAPLHGRGLWSYSMLPENQELTVLFGLCVVPASAANGPSHFLIRMLQNYMLRTPQESNSRATESQRKQVFQDRRKPSPLRTLECQDRRLVYSGHPDFPHTDRTYKLTHTSHTPHHTLQAWPSKPQMLTLQRKLHQLIWASALRGENDRKY